MAASATDPALQGVWLYAVTAPSAAGFETLSRPMDQAPQRWPRWIATGSSESQVGPTSRGRLAGSSRTWRAPDCTISSGRTLAWDLGSSAWAGDDRLVDRDRRLDPVDVGPRDDADLSPSGLPTSTVTRMNNHSTRAARCRPPGWAARRCSTCGPGGMPGAAWPGRSARWTGSASVTGAPSRRYEVIWRLHVRSR